MPSRQLSTLLLYSILFSSFFILSACKSTPEPVKTVHVTPKKLSHLPYDAATHGKDIVDTQLALGDRNLYLASNGNIKMLSKAQCQIDISAHRGDFRQPESSYNAISAALNDNFNSVEIDVMLLGDGTWVNHHDSQTGRATVHYTGERFKLERMNLKEFKRLKLRDKHNNNLLNERPITAKESFKIFAAQRLPNQKLNVEIKSKANGQKLLELDNMLRKYVGHEGYYFSSSEQDTLVKLRGINPIVYLGFVQGGHPTSIDILRSDLRKGASNDTYYLENHTNIERASNYGTKRYRSRYQDHTSTDALKKLRAKLGYNSGIHLDIRSYMQNSGVKQRAQRLGMKVYSYSLNGTDYHQSQLLKLSKNNLPDGVIVDATPYKICQQLFNAAVPAQRYQAVTDLGQYIVSLPVDADFDRFKEMLGYQHEGYYLSLTSGLKSIYSAKAKVVPASTPTPLLEHGFPTITDEKIDTHTGDSIILTLPSSNAK
ncbi:glycerophosphodiester phosphodiesterase family protein [Shewanella sp. 6_MG-2023]|uniref:glycerophosphodiester phosphodiesterase n=1 Tax=Shewanella sp. 6_MG-2023 TaxID=3062660 RepID=UPI0026E2BCBD|nr:glycerophosphodiester phosphodiesterase family protein [Shewanella sp. 6_MG-2023]MDO6619771.1 glycerophosphodiester phosphodiesterase family protein [Shewanella sp. 6_MG-2023]